MDPGQQITFSLCPKKHKSTTQKIQDETNIIMQPVFWTTMQQEPGRRTTKILQSCTATAFLNTNYSRIVAAIQAGISATMSR